MIASKYALNILNKMFRTEGTAGETYEEELATLKQELGLVQMTELTGEPKWGIQAKTYHAAFKADNYEKGKEIHGLGADGQCDGVTVYHAGTKCADGKYYTNGGRVLGITATAPTLKEALAKAYAGVERITFEDMHVRHDIGAKALKGMEK